VRLPSLNTMLTHDAKPTGSTLLSTTLPLSRFVTTVGRRSEQPPERRPTKTARRLSDRHRCARRYQMPREEASSRSLRAMTVRIVVTPAPWSLGARSVCRLAGACVKVLFATKREVFDESDRRPRPSAAASSRFRPDAPSSPLRIWRVHPPACSAGCALALSPP
jgi:hypothetical protein